MKNMIKKIGFYLLCALCAVCFSCCALTQQTSSSEQQDTASNSIPDSSSLYDSSNDTQEDENELPRVPYGAE